MRMMMMRDDQNNSQNKQVHFANGFPPKEVVSSSRGSPAVNMHGGFFVGLHDDIPSRLTKNSRSIPPLAKGRGQFCAVRKPDTRKDLRSDPFDGHKGAEKTGFTAYPIKHYKQSQVKEKEKKSSHLPIFPRSISLAGQTGLLSMPRVQDVTPKPLDNSGECDKVMSDVEKNSILNELAGIDEVYHHICHGNRDSLQSLVSPMKSKRKKYTATNMQSLHVTAIKGKSFDERSGFHDKDSDKPLAAPSTEETTNVSSSPDAEMVQKILKQPRAILVPLPYFQKQPLRPPLTAPARHKGIHSRPRVYPSRRSAKYPTRRAVSSLSGWSSPSIINFSTAGLPEVNPSRPGTRWCNITGSIKGVQNRSHTGTVAIVAALEPKGVTATPPATAATGLYINQSFYEVPPSDMDEDLCRPELRDGMDLDSVSTSDHSEKMNMDLEFREVKGVTKGKVEDPAEEVMQDVSRDMQNMNLSIIVNVTTDDGLTTEDVEIYDPANRDFDKELQAAQEIQEAHESAKQRQKELETLLDEHEEIIKEVHQLEEDLLSQ